MRFCLSNRGNCCEVDLGKQNKHLLFGGLKPSIYLHMDGNRAVPTWHDFNLLKKNWLDFELFSVELRNPGFETGHGWKAWNREVSVPIGMIKECYFHVHVYSICMTIRNTW